jgi:hypothetical protein
VKKSAGRFFQDASDNTGGGIDTKAELFKRIGGVQSAALNGTVRHPTIRRSGQFG